MMRDFASLLFRWATVMARSSLFFPPDETEFPAALQTAFNLFDRTERGSHAPDSAPSDALRFPNTGLNIENEYELSFIRETLASIAKRFSTKGRPRSAPFARNRQSSQEDILAAARCVFWKRQEQTNSTRQRIPQWLATAAAAGA
jgi:hypothetical protein